jgi:hypothetical protein
VDASSIKYEMAPGSGRYRHGTITFAVKKGKSLDLQKLHESLRATRLGKRTNSGVNWFEITAEGNVVVRDKEARIDVSGTKQQFTLSDDPKAKPKKGNKTAYQSLREAQARGEKIVSVTGRLQDWDGKWPGVLAKLEELAKEKDKPGTKPRVLVVTDFQTAKK